MNLYLFEDSLAEQLTPIALTRPVFELVCGREALRRRLQRWLPTESWGARVRPQLAAVYAEEQPSCVVNQQVGDGSGPTLVVNGRWVPEGRQCLEAADTGTAGFVDGELAWIILEPQDARLLVADNFEITLNGIARTRAAVETRGTMIARPWHLVEQNTQQLVNDFHDAGLSQLSSASHVQMLGDPADFYIDETADIDPYVVIDARKGPVSIERGVRILSFTRIEGPCHIGADSQVFRALIHEGTTIGPNCRVGGEIENSILHGCVNKYHEGFLGHSYVCPWVNMGAMTTTSDLKSDYSNVKVPLSGELIDTESIKVGTFIGDHTKTAIDSMFNTGSSIGVMTLVLPGGRLMPRHVPSFCNINLGVLSDDWPLEKSIASARVAMQRRDCELTPAAENLLRYLHEQTADERATAIARAANRRGERT